MLFKPAAKQRLNLRRKLKHVTLLKKIPLSSDTVKGHTTEMASHAEDHNGTRVR
jgi:hypothetical protein